MKIKSQVNAGNTNIDMSNRGGSGGGGSQWALIPADFYDVTIKEMKTGTYEGKASKDGKQIKNKNHAKGLWTYAKLMPHVIFHNENNTEITRQDFVLGVIDGGVIMRPDGDETKLPIWAGNSGALFMLKSMGLFVDLGDGQFELDLETDNISDRVVRVRTAYAGYIKGHKNFTSDEISGMLAELYGGNGYSFNDVSPLVLLWNVQHAYATIVNDGTPVDADEVTLEMCHDVFDPESDFNAEQDETRLKLKNYIVGWYHLNDRDVESGGFFADPDTPEDRVAPVFVNEQAYEAYNKLVEADENADASTAGW